MHRVLGVFHAALAVPNLRFLYTRLLALLLHSSRLASL